MYSIKLSDIILNKWMHDTPDQRKEAIRMSQDFLILFSLNLSKESAMKRENTDLNIKTRENKPAT